MSLDNLPGVSFCETDAETIEKSIITIYEKLTEKTLFPGDPVRLFLESLAAVVIQQRNLIDHTGKQNLLRYAAGSHLDNLGAMTSTERLTAAHAVTTIRFSLSAPLSHAVPVPQGTRVTPDGKLMFETVEYAEVPAGSFYVNVAARCQAAGSGGNGLLPGQVSKMVDPVPYINEVANVTTTEGGADIEDDEPYRDRIHTAPESFSVAGPALAYSHWAKSAHQTIEDVAVFRADPLADLSESVLNSILAPLAIDHTGMDLEAKRAAVGSALAPSIVRVAPLLKNGEIPGVEVLAQVDQALKNNNVRPLTDKVEVVAPAAVNYDLSFTYYVAASNIPTITEIQSRVAAAVDEYLLWQRSKLGRDINPHKLVQLVTAAGAKRLDIVSPAFTALGENQVPQDQAVNVQYGGVEND